MKWPAQPPAQQQTMIGKCRHANGAVKQFGRLYPRHLAVKAGPRSLSYDALNRAANRIAAFILSVLGQEFPGRTGTI